MTFQAPATMAAESDPRLARVRPAASAVSASRPSKSLVAGLVVASSVHALALAWCAAVRIGSTEQPFEFHGDSIVVQAALVSSAGNPSPVVEIDEVSPEPMVVVEPDAVRIADRRYVRESSHVEIDRVRPAEPPLDRAVSPPSPVEPSRRAESPADRPPEPAAPAPRQRARNVVPSPVSQAAVPRTAGTRSSHLPEMVFNPPPSYPQSAIAEGRAGVVKLAVTIRRDGTVREVRVIRSSGHAVLDGAAATAIRQWRARSWEGGPDETVVELPIRFRIPR